MKPVAAIFAVTVSAAALSAIIGGEGIELLLTPAVSRGFGTTRTGVLIGGVGTETLEVPSADVAETEKE